MEPIPDHLRKHLKILFVGFNPSIKSSETGHHYANPNNRFWTILYRSGLTPVKLSAQEDARLLEYGYGLTNIVSRPTKEAADITKAEYQRGRVDLLDKITRYHPKVVCFVGKGVYQEFSQKRQVPWGMQDDPVSSSYEFVAPSSSGLVRMKLDEITAIYQKLTEVLKKGDGHQWN
ncbi:G/U mismatch-specific DNA glycosylase [Sediminibacillus dalangtanensis]|uniref:G/U mismatch-specific DNA glycosylase n=1 Tax=Sediminibacillus dalangtanensis TaxID=2729421 RepID=A0ABX7VXT6_9BACI|nr:G/U mismatch-specific DNA glycosylase [Sediminibacillus dalangtanensis]QTN01379.1 G/U mismatch-specific DNA glycosylase [Sediminibacillus dalangtanensis]